MIKKGTPEEKLKAAKEYYQKKDYVRAQTLLEELKDLYFGRKEREEIMYLYAYSHYGVGEFLLAGYYFSSFAQDYALSPKREEAVYMTAVCRYRKAMPVELDQTPTKDAITALQSFINQYPNSTFIPDCNSKIDELRLRLLKKVYESAKLYHSLGYYQSAVVACTNAIEDYPDMINRAELSYYIVNASYLYAKNSILSKQEERYNETLANAKQYIAEFGENSEYYKAVIRIKEKTQAEMSAF